MLPFALRVLHHGRAGHLARTTIRCLSTQPHAPPADTVDFGYQTVPRDQKQSLVGKVFSNVASNYDLMNDLMSGGLHRLWKDRLVEVLDPFPGMQHLDVAGGTGDVAFRVLQAIRATEQLDTRWQRQCGQSHHQQWPQQQQAPQHGQHGGLQLQPHTAQSDHLQQFQQQQQQQQQPPPWQAQQQQQRVEREAQCPPNGEVTVFDINAEMLEVGKSRATTQGLISGLHWVQGNAEQLPFADGSMDSYTVAFGIRNVTNRHAALCEAHRVLKRGGRLLCLEFSHVSVPVLKEMYDMYSFNIIPKVGGVVAKDEQSYQYLVESIRQFPDQETWAEQIRAAGFKAVTYENITGGVVAIHSGFKL